MSDPGHPAAPFISRRGADLRYSSYDVLVVGGGIAGLTAALELPIGGT